MSLVHHLEIVVIFFPTLPASQLFVLPCSTSTILILFIALLAILILENENKISYYIKYITNKTKDLISKYANYLS